MNDLRYAFRMLLKSPGFSLIAIATLALGIGLNTAIFSLINDLFLRGLSFKEPQRIVHMNSNALERKLLELAISVTRFELYRQSQTVFDGFRGESVTAFTLTGLGDAVQIFGVCATSEYFNVLGVIPIRGRTSPPDEEQGADVALVTDNFWRNRTVSHPNISGPVTPLAAVLHTLVGVIPNLPF